MERRGKHTNADPSPLLRCALTRPPHRRRAAARIDVPPRRLWSQVGITSDEDADVDEEAEDATHNADGRRCVVHLTAKCLLTSDSRVRRRGEKNKHQLDGPEIFSAQAVCVVRFGSGGPAGQPPPRSVAHTLSTRRAV
jgi:hypothetical protein